MANTRITVNGQQYDSPEAMPPDVRRMYEEAMRAWGASRAGGSGGGTQVFTGQVDPLGSGLVVNRIVTVNDRTYGSVDELPPEVRKVYEDALAGTSPQTTHPTSLHVSVNVAGPRVRSLDSSRPHASGLVPIESNLESRIRSIPVSLAIVIALALILWLFLGR